MQTHQAHQDNMELDQQLPKPQAFVLHSGGIDSTTCLYMAVKEFGPENTRAFSLHYGQRHEKEMYAARDICHLLQVRHQIVQMAEQPQSMLTNSEVEIPNASYADLEGVSPTYVPFRNGQLLSYAAALASAELKGHQYGALYFGAHSEDAANWAYPDCTPEFIGAMANAIHIGTYFKLRLMTPLGWMNKADVVRAGEKLLIPWTLTWSCYKGGAKHCGVCPTCRSRKEAFQEALGMDPTEYEA